MLSLRQDDGADAKCDQEHPQDQGEDLAAMSSSRSCMDDFECLTRLGAGSFGTVYKVRRRADSNLYVLKSVRIGRHSMQTPIVKALLIIITTHFFR